MKRLLLLSFVALGLNAIGQTYTVQSQGNWNTATTFNPNGIPVSGDTIYMLDNNLITTDNFHEADKIIIESNTSHTSVLLGNGENDSVAVNTIELIPSSSNQARILLRSGKLTILDSLFRSGAGSKPFHLRTYNTGNRGTEAKHLYLKGKYLMQSNDKIRRSNTGGIDSAGYSFTIHCDNNDTITLPFRGGCTYDKIVVYNGTVFSLDRDIDNDFLVSELKVLSGGKLFSNGQELLLDSLASSVILENGAIFEFDVSDTIPTHYNGDNSGYVVETQGTADFIVSGANAVIANKESSDNFDLGELTLVGNSSKRIISDIGNGNGELLIENIYLDEGTLVVASDLSSITGSIYVADGAILELTDGGVLPGSAHLDLDIGSTVFYNHESSATIAELNYFNLRIGDNNTQQSDLSKKVVNGPVSVRGELSFANNSLVLEIDGDTLTLVSNGTRSAFISQISGEIKYANNGKINVERHIELANYNDGDGDKNLKDYSTPLVDGTLEDFQNGGMYILGIPGSNYPSLDPNVFFMNEDSTSQGDVDYVKGYFAPTNITNEIANQVNGTGRIFSNAFRVYEGTYDGRPNIDIDFVGEVNQGNINFRLRYTEEEPGVDHSDFDGYNLIGNPYPCAISFESIYNNASGNFVNSESGDGIGPIIYVVAPNDGGSNYLVYNAHTNAGDLEADTIPIAQGFWLKTYNSAGTDVNYNFTIGENDKVSTDKNTYKSGSASSSETFSIQLLDEENSLKDRVMLYFNENASFEFNNLFDAKKLSEYNLKDSAYIDLLHNKTHNEMNVILKSLPLNEDDLSVDFHVQILRDRSKIKFDNLNSFSDAFSCYYLKNNVTGEIIDLNINDTYTFNRSGFYSMTLNAKNSSLPVSFEDKLPSCYGAADGKLIVNTENLNSNHHLRLYNNGNIIDDAQVTANEMVFKNLPSDDYEVRIVGIDAQCAHTFPVRVEASPEISVTLTNNDLSTLGDEVVFESVIKNAQSITWYINGEVMSSSSSMLNHTFEEAGRYVITLEVTGNQGRCLVKDEIVHWVQSIEDETSITDINPLNKLQFSRTEERIALKNLPIGSEIYLYQLNGELIASEISKSTSWSYDYKERDVVIVLVEKSGNRWVKKLGTM